MTTVIKPNPPFRVILMDAIDAYYYADLYDDLKGEPRMFLFDTVENEKVAKQLADALFVVKNYKWESLEPMNELDSGWDVQVRDANSKVVHRGHWDYKDKWIGK